MGTFKKDMAAYRREMKEMEARSNAIQGSMQQKEPPKRIVLNKEGIPDIGANLPPELQKIIPKIVTVLLIAAMMILYFFTSVRR
ncbi:MAG: hypothetical protein N2Z74_04030 [Syntrophales bacterium]|nr:hypothetical protein [Syntrophales bacterium]